MNHKLRILKVLAQSRDVINSVLQIVWDVLHNGHIVRRLSLAGAWYITYLTVQFCFTAAKESNYDPAVIGATVAMLTPISGLMGFAIKFYNDGRKDKKGSDNA